MKTYKNEWTEEDFANIEKSLVQHFSDKLSISNYNALDNKLGLAYTSSSGIGMLSICNLQLAYDSKWNYEYFVIDNDGNHLAILWDENEVEKVINLSQVSDSIAESLRKMTVNGCVVSLPPISDGSLSNYADVRKALLNAGAKYKKNTFVFPSDAQPYIDRLCGGEKVNIKKEFQFFATPAHLADKLVEAANIRVGDTILEPSAGQGAILEAIFRAPVSFSYPVDYCELMNTNRSVLEAKIDSGIRAQYVGEDFLLLDGNYKWDRIIANPPFSKNQDIDHVRHMWDCLAPGGRIVTIASKHWQFASGKKEKEFKRWLDAIGAEVTDIEAGMFNESGTKVATCMIIINKPL